METDRMIKVLETERECILRQDTPKCHRYEHEGCLKCDLCLETKEVVETYTEIIERIRKEKYE